jgi:hypothetical protein
MKLKILGFFLLLIMVFGCKKEDNNVPEILFTKPSANQTFSVSDSINVSAIVSDDDAIREIQLCLVNENRLAVSKNYIFKATTNPYLLDFQYPIDNDMLSSGKYYLRIKAYDNDDAVKNKYQEIYINELPKELKNIVVIKKSGVHIIVEMLDSSFQSTLWNPIYTDFSAAAVDSKNQQLIIAGNIIGDIVAYHTETQTANWSIPAIPNPPFPFCTHLCVENNEVLISLYYDNLFKIYSSSGSLIQSTPTDIPDFYPVFAYKSSYYYIVGIRGISGTNAIMLLHPSSLYMHNCHFISHKIIALFDYDDDAVFCFGNNAGQGIMEIYKISDNNSWTPHTIPNGEIYDVAEIAKGEYYIAHTNGLYKYKYFNNSLVQILSSTNPRKIAYDKENLALYMHENTGLFSSYSMSGIPSLINQQTVNDSVLDIQLLFNK